MTQPTLHNLQQHIPWILTAADALSYSVSLRQQRTTVKGEYLNPLTLVWSSSQCVDHASIDRSFNICDPVGLNGQTRLVQTLHNRRTAVSLLGTPPVALTASV